MIAKRIIKIARQGGEIGTYSVAEVADFYACGTFNDADFYWHEGMSDWKSLSYFYASEVYRSQSISDSRWTVMGLWRSLCQAATATILNVRVFHVRFRLYRARVTLRAFLKSVDEVWHVVESECVKDAQSNFEKKVRAIGVGDLGFPPSLVAALSGDDIHTLADLKDRRYLQSIPNIGPMREKTILKACDGALEKAKLDSCNVRLMTQRLGRFVSFRESVSSVYGAYVSRLDEKMFLARAATVDVACYLRREDYRVDSRKNIEALEADAASFARRLREVGYELKRVDMASVLADLNDPHVVRAVSEQHSKITFVIDQTQIRGGEVIGYAGSCIVGWFALVVFGIYLFLRLMFWLLGWPWI